MVRASDPLCIDVETSGLDWHTQFVIGYAISDGQDAIYIPVRHGGGGNVPGCEQPPDSPTARYTPVPFERALAKELKDRPRQWRVVNHNIRFDMHFCANHGVYFGENVSCTMNNQCLIDERTERFSLEFLSRKYGVFAKKASGMYAHLANKFGCKPDRKAMEHFWKLPGNDPVVVEYACSDAQGTVQLWHKQQEEIAEQRLEDVYRLENALIPVLFRMERRGIRINEEVLERALKECDGKIKGALSMLPEGMNVNSGPQVRRYVEQYRTDWPTTPAGNPSFTKKYLESFPEGRLIADVRKWTKVRNSFLGPISTEHVVKGRVHPSIHQNRADEYGTISGRLSCSHPNMFAITKHDKVTAEFIRRVFEADEDKQITEADYKQFEPCLFAHYSGDRNLVEGYNADPPRDVHTIVAEMFKVDRGTTGKRMNMGIFTGMSAKGLAGHMDWDMSYARDMHRAWFDLFPGIKNFQDLAKKAMLRRGYVKTLLGRRARLDDPRFAYRATSRIIQGGNADVIKWKLVELDREFPEIELMLSTYDSVTFQHPDEGPDALDAVQECLEDVNGEPFNLKVPFRIERGTGRNWAEASL